ncbi:unnamed protein product [Dibothriocephalus latus]|uniref:Uncharacterized protein n=1 Tax=Dibothriocephalus latus TaxID=60516 RepID=A0A3P7Q7S9_DIBLA|nr:unnamed protein product [Dibothriocephalus latus]
MVAADPLEDKVSLFRQQANIAANRKESTASALAEAREKLVTAQQQLEAARAKLAKVVDESRNETTDDSFTPVSIPRAEDVSIDFELNHFQLFWKNTLEHFFPYAT